MEHVLFVIMVIGVTIALIGILLPMSIMIWKDALKK